MATLLAQYLPHMPEAERGRLITLAEGSPGRAIMLAEDVSPDRILETVLAAVPVPKIDLAPSTAA